MAAELLQHKIERQEAELQASRRELAAVWKQEEEKTRAAKGTGPGGHPQGTQGEEEKDLVPAGGEEAQ
eukprot:5093701-Heterocapsa_arctica.AAC.1